MAYGESLRYYGHQARDSLTLGLVQLDHTAIIAVQESVVIVFSHATTSSVLASDSSRVHIRSYLMGKTEN